MRRRKYASVVFYCGLAVPKVTGIVTSLGHDHHVLHATLSVGWCTSHLSKEQLDCPLRLQKRRESDSPFPQPLGLLPANWKTGHFVKWRIMKKDGSLIPCGESLSRLSLVRSGSKTCWWDEGQVGCRGGGGGKGGRRAGRNRCRGAGGQSLRLWGVWGEVEGGRWRRLLVATTREPCAILLGRREKDFSDRRRQQLILLCRNRGWKVILVVLNRRWKSLICWGWGREILHHWWWGWRKILILFPILVFNLGILQIL